MDTGEIWYEMQSAVAHLPHDKQINALLDAAFDLVTRAEQFRDKPLEDDE